MTDTVLDLAGPADAGTAEGAEETSGRSRWSVLAAVAGVTVLAVLGAVTLLSGGNAEDDTFTVPRRPAALAADAGASPPATLPAESDLGTGRDPFAPLYVAPADAAGPAGHSDGPPAPADPAPAVPAPAPPLPDDLGGGLPDASEPDDPATAPAPGAPSAGPRVPARTTTVSVDQVRVAEGADGQADLLVDRVPTTVGVGEVFATAFRLVSVQEGPEGRCATLQYGEELFDLCEGDPAVVR